MVAQAGPLLGQSRTLTLVGGHLGVSKLEGSWGLCGASGLGWGSARVPHVPTTSGWMEPLRPGQAGCWSNAQRVSFPKGPSESEKIRR